MHIWVGIDGSTASERALEWAVRFAAGRSDIVKPVSCWSFPAAALITATALPSARAMDEATRVGANKIIDRVRSAVTEPLSGVVIEEPMIVQGEPWHALADLSKDSDLVVVGNRGRGGFEGLVLGSVSSRLASSTHCPLAIVPSSWEPSDTAGKVVIGIDTAKHALVAAHWAGRAFPAAELHLVHAWRIPSLSGIDQVSFDHADFSAAGKESLETVVAELLDIVEDPKQVHQHLVQGDARRALLDHAGPSSTLVVGAQRFRGVSRIMLGSTAQSVVHHLVCPTVIVPVEYGHDAP